MAAYPTPTRFIGLDVHKHYLVAVGVDARPEPDLGPQRGSPWPTWRRWMARTLTPHDAVVLEMTTNTWQLYDELRPTSPRSPWFTHPTSPSSPAPRS